MKKITPEEIMAKYHQLKDSAKRRNLDFNLSLTSVENLLKSKKCKYTGSLFDGKLCIRTVDRVDSSKGYIIGNVVACDARINQLKDNLTTNQIVRLAGILQKHENKC